jgi:hypothetical protein
MCWSAHCTSGSGRGTIRHGQSPCLPRRIRRMQNHHRGSGLPLTGRPRAEASTRVTHSRTHGKSGGNFRCDASSAGHADHGAIYCLFGSGWDFRLPPQPR